MMLLSWGCGLFGVLIAVTIAFPHNHPGKARRRWVVVAWPSVLPSRMCSRNFLGREIFAHREPFSCRRITFEVREGGFEGQVERKSRSANHPMAPDRRTTLSCPKNAIVVFKNFPSPNPAPPATPPGTTVIWRRWGAYGAKDVGRPRAKVIAKRFARVGPRCAMICADVEILCRKGIGRQFDPKNFPRFLPFGWTGLRRAQFRHPQQAADIKSRFRRRGKTAARGWGRRNR